MKNKKHLSSQDVYEILMGYWEKEKRHPIQMAGQHSGMVFELFGDPPSTMPSTERKILKQTNDLEVELIQLEARIMALGSGFVAINMGTGFGEVKEKEIINAIQRFSGTLHDYSGDILESSQNCHKMVMDIRSKLRDKYL